MRNWVVSKITESWIDVSLLFFFFFVNKRSSLYVSVRREELNFKERHRRVIRNGRPFQTALEEVHKHTSKR